MRKWCPVARKDAKQYAAADGRMQEIPARGAFALKKSPHWSRRANNRRLRRMMVPGGRGRLQPVSIAGYCSNERPIGSGKSRVEPWR